MWQRTKNYLQRFITAGINWSSDNCMTLAASIAYYFALTLFPILFVLLSGIGMFLGQTELGRDAKSQLLDVVGDQVSPEFESQIEEVLDQVSLQAGVGGPLGVTLLLITSVGVFIQLDYSFQMIWKGKASSSGIWNAVKEVVFARAKAFLMLLSLGGLMLFIFISGFIVSALEDRIAKEFFLPDGTIGTVEFATTIVINAIVFTLLYRYVPRVKVSWGAALQGGLVATILWEIGRQGMAMYMVRSEYGSAYGVLGSFLAIMLWAFFGAAVILYGAEFAALAGNGKNEEGGTSAPA